MKIYIEYFINKPFSIFFWISLMYFFFIKQFYPHFAVCLGIITFVSIIMRVIFHVIDKKCILWSGFIVFFGGTICLAIILLSKGGFLSKQNYEGYLKLELPSEPDYQVKAYQGIAYFFITLAVFQFLLLIYRILKRPRGYLFKLSVPGER